MSALSGDDQVRAFSLLPELERVQKEIDTWAQAGTKKSDQSTTHATCRSGTFERVNGSAGLLSDDLG